MEYLSELLQNEALNKRLIRKVDVRLTPLLCGTLFLHYTDKSAISHAAVYFVCLYVAQRTINSGIANFGR
jgi:hypothetical protein